MMPLTLIQQREVQQIAQSYFCNDCNNYARVAIQEDGLLLSECCPKFGEYMTNEIASISTSIITRDLLGEL